MLRAGPLWTPRFFLSNVMFETVKKGIQNFARICLIFRLVCVLFEGKNGEKLQKVRRDPNFLQPTTWPGAVPTFMQKFVGISPVVFESIEHNEKALLIYTSSKLAPRAISRQILCLNSSQGPSDFFYQGCLAGRLFYYHNSTFFLKFTSVQYVLNIDPKI